MAELFFCKGCRQHFPIEAFQKNVRKGRDGIRTPCKLCIRERRRGKQIRRWKPGESRGSPEKRESRRLLRFAVAFGQIIKPDKCEECRKLVPKKFLDGHHTDYKKPLDVRWLCRSCHGLERITWCLPTGALARSPETEQVAKPPWQESRADLEARYAARAAKPS